MAAALLKSAPAPRSAERDELAFEIGSLADARRAAEALDAAITAAEEKKWKAHSAIDAAEKAAENAKGPWSEYQVQVALGTGGQAPISPRAARAAATEAQNAYEAARETLEGLRALVPDRRHSVKWSEDRVAERLKNVVKSEPAVRALFERGERLYREFVALRSVLDYLGLRGMRPGEPPEYWRVASTDPALQEPWRTALAQLELDADAPLPTD